MQRCLWKAVGPRKQWTTHRLVTTINYIPSGPTQPFKISKHLTIKGDRPDTQAPERLPKNESLDPGSVAGPAQPLKIRKLVIGEGDTPRPKNSQASSEPESLDLNSVDGPAQALKIRKLIPRKDDTPDPQDTQSSLESGFLDPCTVGEWKVTNGIDIRFLMRRVPHSVAVITSNMPCHNPPESFCGMTVSSFNTVCLEPKVIVSFNVKQPSATYDAIQASGQFNVHLINSTTQGAAIAELFATGRGRETFKDIQQRDNDSEVVSSTLSNEELAEREPDLLRSNNVMFTLQCKLLEQTVKVADHVIVLGEVVTHRLPPAVQTWDGMSLGMCYVNRLYRRPGRVQLLPGERARVKKASSATEATASSTPAPEDGSSDDDEDNTMPFVY